MRVLFRMNNQTGRPLVTGEVVPSHALGIGLAFLGGAIVSASALHPAALQVKKKGLKITTRYTFFTPILFLSQPLLPCYLFLTPLSPDYFIAALINFSIFHCLILYCPIPYQQRYR